MRHIEERGVVFVDKHHHLSPGLLINSHDEVCQPEIGRRGMEFHSEAFLIHLQYI